MGKSLLQKHRHQNLLIWLVCQPMMALTGRWTLYWSFLLPHGPDGVFVWEGKRALFCSLIPHHPTTLQFSTSTSTRQVITVTITDAKAWKSRVLSWNVKVSMWMNRRERESMRGRESRDKERGWKKRGKQEDSIFSIFLQLFPSIVKLFPLNWLTFKRSTSN